MIGKTLSHYEITALIGEGGMGEVYRGRDVRLDRHVAVKILPPHFAEDEARLRRFEREAKTISNLSHPGICTLHDVGHRDGVHYLVMELLEGETLAERLRRGRLPVDEVLDLAARISEALECAHARGIVHRDLKPENIMLTATGPKILDFGLAKAATAAISGTSEEAATVPVAESAFTEKGSILGTVPYMAPEQLEGRAADVRSDIFALGGIIYEMVTGKRAFEGESRIKLVAAIVERDVEPISSILPRVPAGLEHLVRACLEKDPAQRWQSARDLVYQLDWIAEGWTGTARPAEGGSNTVRTRVGWMLAMLVLIVAAFVLGKESVSENRPDRETTRFTFEAPGYYLWTPTPSPDGRMILYPSTEHGASRLFVRRLDSLGPQELRGTDGVFQGFWSPDGRHVAFFTKGELRRVPVTGGPPETICSNTGTYGHGDWNASRTIIFDAGPDDSPGIWKVSASGGVAVPAFLPDTTGKGGDYAWPSFLPDGRRCLFIEVGAAEAGGQYRLVCGDLETGEVKNLGTVGSRAEYAEPGYVLYVTTGTLVARPFDLGTATFTGEPVPQAELGLAEGGRTTFSVSNGGVLAYQSPRREESRLLFLDRSGRITGEVGEPVFGVYQDPRLSPDGRRLAIVHRSPDTKTENIWVHDLVRGTASRITFNQGQDLSPIWSPDGRSLDYGYKGQDATYLIRVDAGGSGASDTLLTLDHGTPAMPMAWLRNETSIILGTFRPETMADLLIANVAEDKPVEPLLASAFREWGAVLSPDDRWLAYASDQTGRMEVYVRSFPEGDERLQISRSGGGSPCWRGDGAELFYSDGERLMAVDVETKNGFHVSAPSVLFDLPGDVNPWQFAIAADGNRSIWVEVTGDEMARYTVVMNWDAELGTKR